jgi:CDP-diacylglycerol--serine O-phosphatidyltransferase
MKIFTIPNGITLLNLLSGCLSVVYAFNDQLIPAAILIFVAGVFDFFDGFIARLLNAYSEIGKQLDSLADIVSFGFAPSVILFKLIEWSILNNYPNFEMNHPILNSVFPGLAFLITLFSALRLAKFNIDERQSDSFIGVPTPATGFLIASFPFIIVNYPKLHAYLLNVNVLFPIIIILSYLLISEIPLISLKFKNFGFKGNKSRYTLLIASLVLLILFKISAFPIIFCLYLIISAVDRYCIQ